MNPQFIEDVLTNDFAVQMVGNDALDTQRVSAFAESHGFINVGAISHLPGVYLFRFLAEADRNNATVRSRASHAPSSIVHHIDAFSSDILTNRARALASRATLSSDSSVSPFTSSIWNSEEQKRTTRSEELMVDAFERQVLRTRYRRRAYSAPVSDPMYSAQWHLHGSQYSVNAPACWDTGFTGKDVLIGIVDDGLATTHPDIAEKYVAEASWDVNYHDSDPTPFSYDAHGTESAGCAAAAENSHCGIGSAPDAKLAALRLLAKSTSDSDEATALGYKHDMIDIYSNSWGPTDDAKRLDGPGGLTMAAFKDAVDNGRDGKGVIYVWAGGNGRSSSDNVNYDGYANLPYTVAVGALGSDGKYSYYSEPGAALMACAPSSSRSSKITTTDLQSSSWHECSTSFGGTSAASPIFAGVVACMLEANPDLTWRDVQGIIAHASVKVDSHNSDWQTNGAGLEFNHNYGFGKADALKYTQLAQTWSAYPEQKQIDISRPDDASTMSGNELSFEFTVDSPSTVAEHVQLHLHATASHRGTASITLTSPSGTVSRLQESHSRDSHSNIVWTYMSVANWGESVQGVWRVDIHESSYSISVQTIGLTIFGHDE